MKKGERRKLELLQIAYRMFVSRGYENTSVDDIIGEAGIARGSCWNKGTPVYRLRGSRWKKYPRLSRTSFFPMSSLV